MERPVTDDLSPGYQCCVYNSYVMNDLPDGSVAATELRRNPAAYLDEVRAGATFTITRGSRVAGRLVPPVDEEGSNDE
jgi:prevent-host-death family protein